jgi:hypothetical protein
MREVHSFFTIGKVMGKFPESGSKVERVAPFLFDLLARNNLARLLVLALIDRQFSRLCVLWQPLKQF